MDSPRRRPPSNRCRLTGPPAATCRDDVVPLGEIRQEGTCYLQKRVEKAYLMSPSATATSSPSTPPPAAP